MKKSLFFTLLTFLLAMPSIARDFEYNGLWYTVLDEEAKTCQTKAGSWGSGAGNQVSGDIIIPAEASDGSNTYSVIAIGSRSFYYCDGLTSVVIPNSVKSIEDWAFFACGRLASVEIPSSVNSIGWESFTYCASLTSIVLPNSITEIQYGAFRNCSRLTSIEIPVSVISLDGSSFESCTSLTTVEIPASVIEIDSNPFGGCSSLQGIRVAEGNPEYVGVEGILYSKDMKRLIGYPAGFSNETFVIPSSVTSIEGLAFDGCTSLTSIEIPNSVTHTGNGAFRGCSGLTSVILSDSMTEIRQNTFNSCTSLTSIEIPNSITRIWFGAFGSCSGLTSVILPESITDIDMSTFFDCPSLQEIKCNAVNPPTIYDNTFEGVNKETCTLNVPDKAIEAYKSAEYWNEFLNIHGNTSGEGEVELDLTNYDEPCEVYNLRGEMMVEGTEDLAPGIYLIKRGDTVKKVIIK